MGEERSIKVIGAGNVGIASVLASTIPMGAVIISEIKEAQEEKKELDNTIDLLGEELKQKKFYENDMLPEGQKKFRKGGNNRKKKKRRK